MDIINYILIRKKGYVLLILFLLLVATLIFRKNISYLSFYSILFFYILILFSQIFVFGNRIFIFIALILFIICPFLLIFKQDTIAEYFATYVYYFLCIGVIGFLVDILKEKLKKRGKLEIHKYFIIFPISFLIAFTIFFYFNNYFILFRDIQLLFLKNINKQEYFSEYYKNWDRIFINGKFINSGVLMDITFYDEKLRFVNQAHIEGWALDKNSMENSGIDKVEVWLDGKPGQGEFLGNANLGINLNPVITSFTEDKFKNCGFTADINIENINSGRHKLFIYARSVLFGWSYKEINIETINMRDYPNKNKIKEAELFNNNVRINIDKPIEHQIISNDFEVEGWAIDTNASLNSNNPGVDKIEIWLDGYPGIGRLLFYGNLNKERSDLVPVFGQQFLKSGYLYKLNKNNFSDGKHTIFIFVHSIYSGWSKNSVRIEIK